MVTIRMQRSGAKKKPFYRIVVSEHASPRDGRFIEQLGYYNPTGKNKDYKVDAERASQWLQQGAQASDAVRGLLKKEGVAGV